MERDVKVIKRVLKNNFIIGAKHEGYDEIAEILEQIMPELNRRNALLARGQEVSNLSQCVKSSARVSLREPLYITTVFPEWYVKQKTERRILEEKTEEGLVYVGISQGLRYPPEKIVEDMTKRGIVVTYVPGIISTNITTETVTLYYSPDPFVEHSSPERIAIHIYDKVGRKLAEQLRRVRPIWSLDQYTIYGAPLHEFHILRSIDRILRNYKEKEILKDAVRNEEIPSHIRIMFGLYMLQHKENRPYSIDEISTYIKMDYARVSSTINRWYFQMQRGSMPRRFEFYTNEQTGLIEKVKFIKNVIYQLIPFAFSYITSTLFEKDKRIRELVEKYSLPPLRRTRKLWKLPM